jgi:hypothetical protein
MRKTEMKKIWIACLVVAMAGLVIGGGSLFAGDHDHKERTVIRSGSGSGAYLGVVMSRTVKDQEDSGIVIKSVMDDSPAEEAGLEDGDRIVGVAGNAIEEMDDFISAIRELEPGDNLKITVLRGGDKLNLTATLAEASEQNDFRFEFDKGYNAPFVYKFDEDQAGKWQEWAEKFSHEHDEKYAEAWEQYAEKMKESFEGGDWRHLMENRLVVPFGGPRLGVELVRTTPELRTHLGGTEEAGVLVGKVSENSAAEEAGVEVGDLIVAAGGIPITSTTDLLKVIHKSSGEDLEIEVIRDGRSVYLTAAIEESDRAFGDRSSIAPMPPMPPMPTMPAMPDVAFVPAVEVVAPTVWVEAPHVTAPVAPTVPVVAPKVPIVEPNVWFAAPTVVAPVAPIPAPDAKNVWLEEVML